MLLTRIYHTTLWNNQVVMFYLLFVFHLVELCFCHSQSHTAAPSRPPVNLTVEATTSDSITLNWIPPDIQSRNGIITGYLVNVTAVETGETFQASSTTTNLVVQSLEPFTTYNCTIAAETSAGIGPFSIPLTVQTNETGKSYYMHVTVQLDTEIMSSQI